MRGTWLRNPRQPMLPLLLRRSIGQWVPLVPHSSGAASPLYVSAWKHERLLGLPIPIYFAFFPQPLPPR